MRSKGNETCHAVDRKEVIFVQNSSQCSIPDEENFQQRDTRYSPVAANSFIALAIYGKKSSILNVMGNDRQAEFMPGLI